MKIVTRTFNFLKTYLNSDTYYELTEAVSVVLLGIFSAVSVVSFLIAIYATVVKHNFPTMVIVGALSGFLLFMVVYILVSYTIDQLQK